MTIGFRRATDSDASILAEYNCRLAWETEQKILPRDTVQNGVLRGLAKADEVQYWVAESSCHDSSGTPIVVGQLMLTREWSDWRDGWIIWLQSVYVHPDFRRQGVFSQLFEHVAEQLHQQTDIVAIRLYVEQENERARLTYQKLGFISPGYLVMERPPVTRTGNDG